MEDKNRKLAEKNSLLKGELEKLKINQTKLLRENINYRFSDNIMHRNLLNMLEANLKHIEAALKRTQAMKENLVLDNIKEEDFEDDLLNNIKESTIQTQSQSIKKNESKKRKKTKQKYFNPKKNNKM